MSIVEETWNELGQEIQARGFHVWVRTVPFQRKIGSIWMPPKLQQFHGELPHLVTIRAVVLSAGTNGQAKELKPGDIVAFKRLHFATFKKVGPAEDQEKVGWIDSNEVLWIEKETAHDDEVSAAVA
jgi:hypothetical protein